MKLKNKVALITGAGSGIGREIAELFSEEGALCILTGLHLEKLQEVEYELRKRKLQAESFIMDVSNKEQVQQVVKKVLSKYKKIDILVNNAGIAVWGNILEVTHQQFEDHMQINALGYFYCIKEVIPSMVRNHAGCIINIISSTAKVTKANRVAYAASKYAQAGLSNAVHEDVKDKGVNVTAIYPGKADTPIHAMAKEDPERKKMLDPKEVAILALYVACLPANVKMKEVGIESSS